MPPQDSNKENVVELLESEPIEHRSDELEAEVNLESVQLQEPEETVNENGQSPALSAGDAEVGEPDNFEADILPPQSSQETIGEQGWGQDEVTVETAEEVGNDKIAEQDEIHLDITVVTEEASTEEGGDEILSEMNVSIEEEPKEADGAVEQQQEEVMVEQVNDPQDEEIMTLGDDAFQDMAGNDAKSEDEESFILLGDDDDDDDDDNDDGTEKEESSTAPKGRKRRKSCKSIKSNKSSKSVKSRQSTAEQRSLRELDARRKSSASTHPTQFEGEEQEGEEEEEEEEEEEKEEQMTEYERYQYYLMYDKLYKEYQEELNKNSYFVKKLAAYFQKRKLYHVLQEGKLTLDVQKKYEKQLEDYDHITQLEERAQLAIEEQVKDLREKCVNKEQEACLCFQRLQQYEAEVGKEIIHSESEKHYGEKLIDRYLKRQKIQLNNLKKIRMDYIKIRNRVTETQEALDAIDNLGPDLHLIDYEQLKLDNRNLRDKLEEKDSELVKVRTRCQNVVQVLAHRREKSDALQADLGFLNETLANVTGEYEDVREQLNGLKMDRDYYRSEIEKMKKQAGLLSKPKLLRDMSDTVDEGQLLTQRLDDIRNEYGVLATKVKNIRKNKSSRDKLEMIQARMMRGSGLRAAGVVDSGSMLGDFDI